MGGALLAKIEDFSPRIGCHRLFRPRDFRVPLPEHQKPKYRYCECEGASKRSGKAVQIKL
jgi:hypothetical protein